ncbi:putative caspase-like protein [Bradyrhizobium sp. AZCC 1678]
MRRLGGDRVETMRLARSLSILSVCLVAMSGLAGHLNTAAAQQTEKRIALVVGNAAYAKSPLATAANDAGLIAQTLQAAGFDVIGARDLDGDTLRKSFRDFIQKAESSGPDTVAMVYLAGYGLQLAGENYFVPVDSAINRDTDVPIEALRTGDYIRQLASLPLKAGIVVLDAGRQQPFVNGQIASGLALVEADPHMLIAFNAAPGTVAPAEQGPYGVYAQSLAEMIRTGGLPLPEVFNRVRLRVNEASKGAQVPWDSQKVDAAFTFFERAPDAPAAAATPPDQVAAVRSKPIRDLGVQDAYAAVLERDTLPAYEDFLAAYPDDPMAKRVRAIAAARREAITWRRTYRADTPNAYWSYLQRYPRGPHAADARRRLAILTAPIEPPPTFDVIDYDVPPPPPEEFIYIDRPVLAFGDPEFDFVPPPPPPVYYLPPPPEDFVILEPPPPPIGLFILPQPIFVPIPVYVRPPRYVAPPPNNIIFANIHNRAVINNVINRPQTPLPAVGPGARPIGRPGAPEATVAPAQRGGATPTLPPAVAQRATLIQQGRAPVPPSATINPAVRTGLPGAPAGPTGRPNATQPVNAPPGTSPSTQPSPRINALPVPGARGAPPAPPSAAVSPGTVNPNARLAPGAPRPGSAAPTAPSAATGSRPAIGATAPTAPAGQQPRVAAPPPSAAAPPKPSATVAPRPQLQPELRRGPPPSAVQAARPPPPPAARVAPAPPPPRMAAPQPAPRMAAPPPPPARMAAPPPPRMAAPPPPPPRMAAPPPPPPRMAAPAPPPRMAAPPIPARAAPAAAARGCPPGARC